MAIGININQNNGLWLGAGVLAYMFAGKFGPLKTVAKYGGLVAAALGAADVLGIMPISTVTSKIPFLSGYGSWERPSGAYAANVDVRNLPYDPNNYYLPPTY